MSEVMLATDNLTVRLGDRVIVLHRGRAVAELPGADVTEAALLHHAMG